MTTARDALRRPGFRQLTRGWFVINVADAALFLMVAAWTKDLTGSDPAAAGVLVALGVPSLLAPFLGQVADRMSRQRLMVLTCTFIVPVLLSLVFVNGPGAVWLIYLVTFLYGCTGYLIAAAQSGLVRDLLPDEELAVGNGVLSTIDMALRLVSPLIGTGLYVLLGPLAVVALAAIAFASGAALLQKLEIEESAPAEKTPGRYWYDLTAGFRHLWSVPALKRLTITLAIAFGAVGMVNAAVFPAMEQGFGVEPATLGILVSIQGIGSVIGGITAARIIRPLGEPRTVALGMAAMGVGLFPVAGSSLALAIVGLLLIGLGVPWVVVAFSTLRQRLTPNNLQGRTSSAANVALNVPQTGALALSSIAVGLIDYRLLIVATVVIVLVNALTLRNAVVTEPA
ncbi:MAG: MFS transporter [Acidimicrobiales bacterium]|nr:MFS transporter [Acidimicrobiales bacterium]HLV90985.1 MFS transporter [Acidimicrobiia bacterium]